MNVSPLVSTSWLADRLDDPSVAVAEIQYEPDVDEYADGHIPGALSWNWRDLFWDELSREFVTPQQLASRFAGWGIGADTTLVLYSGRNQYAVYGYWVAKSMCGHADVRVLDGSRTKWLLEERPMTRAVPAVAPVDAPVRPDPRDDSTRRGRDDVLAKLGSPGRVLLDARYPEEYRGERVKPGTGFDHGAERHGRIPGASSLPFDQLFQPGDRTLRDPAEIEALFRSVGAAPDQAEEVVAYCRLSHRASLLWFAASEMLSWSHFGVYDGSWTEWGSLVGVPVER